MAELTLWELQQHINTWSKQKGWLDQLTEALMVEADAGFRLPAALIAEKLALIHSEVSEALEEVRNAQSTTDLTVISLGEGNKPEGFAVELADVLIRLLDLAAALNIDLADVVEVKMRYNDSRPYKHGGKTL